MTHSYQERQPFGNILRAVNQKKVKIGSRREEIKTSLSRNGMSKTSAAKKTAEKPASERLVEHARERGFRNRRPAPKGWGLRRSEAQLKKSSGMRRTNFRHEA